MFIHIINQIIVFLFNVTFFTSLFLGLFCIWSWFIVDVLIRKSLLWLKVYKNIVCYIYNRKAFHRWYKEQEQNEKVD